MRYLLNSYIFSSSQFSKLVSFPHWESDSTFLNSCVTLAGFSGIFWHVISLKKWPGLCLTPVLLFFERDSKIFFQVVTLHSTEYYGIWWDGNEHTCMANKHKLVIGSCIGSKAKHKCYQKKKKSALTWWWFSWAL